MVGGRWRREETARLCTTHSAVNTVPTSCSLRTVVLCLCVVHVSRARAVLRFALLRFASRTALGTYFLGFRAKEATCTCVSCACATRVFARWCCALSVCVLRCMRSLFARGVSACRSPLAEAGQEPHPNPKGSTRLHREVTTYTSTPLASLPPTFQVGGLLRIPGLHCSAQSV